MGPSVVLAFSMSLKLKSPKIILNRVYTESMKLRKSRT